MWDPRGTFRSNQPVLPGAMEAGKAFLQKIPHGKPKDITRIYLHQSAESYGCSDAHYNSVIVIANDGWQIRTPNDPRHNMRSSFGSFRYAQHTFRRNLGAVGIAINGLDTPEVTPYDFGPDPLQMHAVEYMCVAAAAYAIAYDIDAQGIADDNHYFDGEPTILTHSEAGNFVGEPRQYLAYGPRPGTGERWDLLVLAPPPASADVVLTSEHAGIVGRELRARIHVLKGMLLHG